MGGFVISPQCPDGLDVLAERKFAVGPSDAVVGEFVGLPPVPDATDEPAAAELIE